MSTTPIIHHPLSQLIPSQLPEFVRENDPNFIAFLQAYYDWLLTTGTQIFFCKILSSTWNSVTLTPNASTVKNAYQGKYLVIGNGPNIGQTFPIQTYDPTTNIATVFTFNGNSPLPNSTIFIQDSSYPEKILAYKDIDKTLDKFIINFRDEFMPNIPGNILADKRKVLKRIKQFYQARGTEDSFRFLFRLMFDEEIEIYYPKVDLFRASAANWYVQNIMYTIPTDTTFDFVNRLLTGVYSGATAVVESATQMIVNAVTVTQLTLSNIFGEFEIDPSTGLPELVKITYAGPPAPVQPTGTSQDLIESSTVVSWLQPYLIADSITIQNPGVNYKVGDQVAISSESTSAVASVSSISQTYYRGSCSVSPAGAIATASESDATHITFVVINSGSDYSSVSPIVTVTGSSGTVSDIVAVVSSGAVTGITATVVGATGFATDNLLVTIAPLSPNEITLAADEVATNNFFDGDTITLIGGTGKGETGIITAYNGTTKVATISGTFVTIPDVSTQYEITHVFGSITSVDINSYEFASVPSIVYDNSYFVSAASFTNPWNVNYTVGAGTNRGMLVGLYANIASAYVPSPPHYIQITYAGVPMTLLGQAVSGSTNDPVLLYWLANPQVGTNVLSVVSDSILLPATALGLSVVSYSGVSQVTPTNIVEPGSWTSGISSGAVVLTLTVAHPNAWMAGVATGGGNSYGAGTGTTRRGSVGTTNSEMFDSNGPLTTGSHSLIAYETISGWGVICELDPAPNAIITTSTGSGAILVPNFGLVAQTEGQWTVGEDGGIGDVPTTPDSFASSNKVLQDSYYWQDFSYDIRSGEQLSEYQTVVRELLHPAGMQLFGSILIKSQVPQFLSPDEIDSTIDITT